MGARQPGRLENDNLARRGRIASAPISASITGAPDSNIKDGAERMNSSALICAILLPISRRFRSPAGLIFSPRAIDRSTAGMVRDRRLDHLFVDRPPLYS